MVLEHNHLRDEHMQREHLPDHVVCVVPGFLHRLPEDIKKLRAEGILINVLWTGEKVADLFNELVPNLVSSYEAYSLLLRAITKHQGSSINNSA